MGYAAQAMSDDLLNGSDPMSWYSLNVGPADLPDEARITAVAAAVDAAWQDAGCPRALAAFTRHESEGRLHCELVIYFSPDAERVAQQLGARPCQDPGPYDLSLLAGG